MNYYSTNLRGNVIRHIVDRINNSENLDFVQYIVTMVHLGEILRSIVLY
jgi:hypothetical protein